VWRSRWRGSVLHRAWLTVWFSLCGCMIQCLAQESTNPPQPRVPMELRAYAIPLPQAKLEEVPAHLKAALVETPSIKRPPVEALCQVRATDAAWLERQYRRQAGAAQAVSLAWCLAYTEDRRVADLVHAGLVGKMWRRWERPDRSALEPLVLIAGLCAQKDDQAMRRLEEMTEPAWWYRHSPAAKDADGTADPGGVVMQMHMTCQALGLSGRPEAAGLLRRLRANRGEYVDAHLDTGPVSLKDGLILGECYLAVYGKQGRTAFRAHLFDEQFMAWCGEWGRSEQGRILLWWAFPPDVFTQAWQDIDKYLQSQIRNQ